MIISKTPFRISFVGGGSDLYEYYKDQPGSVLSTSINKYMYLSMHNYFYKDKHLLKYSQTEEVGNNKEIKHDIIREVFNYFDIRNMDFNSTADIPSGTGMGSSSSFTCGLINICLAHKGLTMDQTEIAKLACYFEIDVLKEPIGKQDQYACAVGGLNLITFHSNQNVEVYKINISDYSINELQNNLFLVYTSKTRRASTILYDQKNNTQFNTSTRSNLNIMSQMARNLVLDVEKGNIDILGQYLSEAWGLKKELSNKISNPIIDELYNLGIKSGSTGGKLLGAGGGGFILFYVPLANHERFKIGMSNFAMLDFKFDDKGTEIVYKD